jgi:hypothetical protein
MECAMRYVESFAAVGLLVATIALVWVTVNMPIMRPS